MRFRIVAGVALLMTALTACAGNDAPRQGAATAISTTAPLPEGYLHVVFNDEGIVVEPALDGVVPQWTTSEALAAVKTNDFFREGRRRVWFGSFGGQAAWLAIADGLTVAPSMGQPMRGYVVAVFADGEVPARTLSGVAETGGDPTVDVAPRRPKYDGRLHITFVTPSGGPIGGSLAKWMMEPAPWAHPRLSLAEARQRSTGPLLGTGGSSERLYFGLFTGLDNHGTMHTRNRAWMVFGDHVRLVDYGGPCCEKRKPEPPMYGFGFSAFSDDAADPWASGLLTAGGATPVVY